MALATDYLTVAEARFDLRVGDQVDDETLLRYIGQGVALVARTTGRDLLEMAAADIDEGLKACVSVATWLRFEGAAQVPRSFYDLCGAYRKFVSDDDPPTPGASFKVAVADVQVAGPYSNSPLGHSLVSTIRVPSDGIAAVRAAFGAGAPFETQWFSIDVAELRRKTPYSGQGAVNTEPNAALEVSVASQSQLWIGWSEAGTFVFDHSTGNFNPFTVYVGRWKATVDD